MSGNVDKISLSSFLKTLREAVSSGKNEIETNKTIQNIFSVLANSENGQISTNDFLQKVIDESASKDSEIFSMLQISAEEVANLTLEDGNNDIISYNDFAKLTLGDEIENIKDGKNLSEDEIQELIDNFYTLLDFDNDEKNTQFDSAFDDVLNTNQNPFRFIKLNKGNTFTLDYDSSKTVVQANIENGIFVNPVVPDIEESAKILSQYVENFAIANKENTDGFIPVKGEANNNNESYFYKSFGENEDKTIVFLKVVKDDEGIKIVQNQSSGGVQTVFCTQVEKNSKFKENTFEQNMFDLGLSEDEINAINKQFDNCVKYNSETSMKKIKSYIKELNLSDANKAKALENLDDKMLDYVIGTQDIPEFSCVASDFVDILLDSSKDKNDKFISKFAKNIDSISDKVLMKIVNQFKTTDLNNLIDTVTSKLNDNEKKDFLIKYSNKLADSNENGLLADFGIYTDKSSGTKIRSLFEGIDVNSLPDKVKSKIEPKIGDAKIEDLYNELSQNNQTLSDYVLNIDKVKPDELIKLAKLYKDNNECMFATFMDEAKGNTSNFINKFFENFNLDTKISKIEARPLGEDIAKFLFDADN